MSFFYVAAQRLHVFLFSELLVLTRPVNRNERNCFQVYRQPIPVRDLALEDLQDGDIRIGGSFRGAFTNGEKGGSWFSPVCLCVFTDIKSHWEFVHCLFLPLTLCHFCVYPAKNVFRVRSLDPAHSQSHTLYVNDIYHKQQWLNCLRAAMAQQQGAPPKVPQGEAAPAKGCSPAASAAVREEETDENCPPASGPKLRPQTLSKTRLEQKFQGPVKRKVTGV